MQCLYCAKQLPLLKRLTKGEFCSEAHRQKYQAEYSQLALTRLLQAKPPGEPLQHEDQSPHTSSGHAGNGLASRFAPPSQPEARPVAKPKPIANPQPAGDPRTSAPPAASRAVIATR